ncbi:DUF6471 domain-containing protein [Alistipes putredinis]|uniref:DUF6471 domain-containing protein n=1 Tax=Alistipes putredinis TaxID=28117 RepID=UPI0024ACE596|nr:DUF6471 domain-containing protein [Alistipes putredinis]
MKDTQNINQAISSFIKGQLKYKRLSYKQFVERLNEKGIDCTLSGFTTRLNRGTFSAAFFIQCLDVLKYDSADVKEIIKNSK